MIKYVTRQTLIDMEKYFHVNKLTAACRVPPLRTRQHNIRKKDISVDHAIIITKFLRRLGFVVDDSGLLTSYESVIKFDKEGRKT